MKSLTSCEGLSKEQIQELIDLAHDNLEKVRLASNKISTQEPTHVGQVFLFFYLQRREMLPLIGMIRDELNITRKIGGDEKSRGVDNSLYVACLVCLLVEENAPKLFDLEHDILYQNFAELFMVANYDFSQILHIIKGKESVFCK